MTAWGQRGAGDFGARLFVRIALLLFLVMSSATFVTEPHGESQTSAEGPLRRHPGNPRYFTNASGRAIYLTGSHFWTTVQTWNPTKVEASQPYSGGPAFETLGEYVKFLKTRGHNFTRLWTFDHFAYESTPSPWMRTGPGTAFDGKPKWDVTRTNPAYLARLRASAQLFRDNGIYVSIMFFRGNMGRGSHPDWRARPFNPSNNVNRELAGLTSDQYNDVSHPHSLMLQKQHLRNIIDALNDMDNVIWEIANEAQPGSYAWQQQLADYVRSYELQKPKQHLVGITSTYPFNNQGLYGTTADWISPGRDGYDPIDPPPADGHKVIISDTDHHLLSKATPSWAWRSFLRGEHPILMENELKWNLEAVRIAMGHTRAQAERMNLVDMTPQNGLAETTYCLADRSNEYLVYTPRGGSFWVDLSDAVGKTLAVEWIDPRTGAIIGGRAVLGGNNRQVFSTPSVAFRWGVNPLNDSGAVLYLKGVGPIRPESAG